MTGDKLYCDREPAYLPNGDVVFSSDRGCGASQCGAAPLAYSDFGLPNLFRVSADGREIQRLTYNKDVDRYPHCLDNGLIGYMRWDYQAALWQWPHSLWTIHPDGTMNDGLFKVHFREPQSVREPRSIPGSGKLVVIACGHHSPPEGAVAWSIRRRGQQSPGLHYVTPHCSPLEGGLGRARPCRKAESPTAESTKRPGRCRRRAFSRPTPSTSRERPAMRPITSTYGETRNWYTAIRRWTFWSMPVRRPDAAHGAVQRRPGRELRHLLPGRRESRYAGREAGDDSLPPHLRAPAMVLRQERR